MLNTYTIPTLPLNFEVETKKVLKQLNLSHRKLAELKGVVQHIPNEQILISTLTLQEAKDSSEVENIVTTQDDLYRAWAGDKAAFTPATKEVLAYREAMNYGFETIRQRGLMTCSTIKEMQARLIMNDAGFRTTPGTQLRRSDGTIVYTPPQDGQEIVRLMSNLEQFINDNQLVDLDPLVKMAIIHHQFESIHPFLDGNGRTGRIINVLYLVLSGLIDIPILYLSRYITHNKTEYYRLLQAIHDNGPNNAVDWEKWILYMLKGIEETADETIRLVNGIAHLMEEYSNILRPLFGKQYSTELLNCLFYHPYTKIEFIEKYMKLNRKTASKYLDAIVNVGLLYKHKMKNSNYYLNIKLIDLFVNHADL